MKKIFYSLSLLFATGCSLISSLLGAERCPDNDGFIRCENDTAVFCESNLVVKRGCDSPERCIFPFTDSIDFDPNRPEAEQIYDGCSIAVTCGNGFVDPNEECDDGNNVDTDNCQSCRENVCGDGVIDFSDQNGDGASDENCEPKGVGGCNDLCQFGCLTNDDCISHISETERACFEDIACNAERVCVATLREEPDDNECTQEVCIIGAGPQTFLPTGIICSVQNQQGTCFNGSCQTDVNACGNGTPEPNQGEQCDDGNDQDDDPCFSNCLRNCLQFPDQEGCGCGNGALDTGEECDDHNPTSGDGCDINCTVTICGNGIVANLEECDDGVNNGNGCDPNCTTPRCGNQIIGTGEQCDDGNQNDNDGCDHDCTFSVCGNGITTQGEACDDGDNQNGDGCDNNCTVSGCGNFIVAGVEQCDDGNSINGDGCDNNCTIPGCGNGITSGNEDCDDANLINGDGCDNNCTTPGCGNGIQSQGEGCDDGNLLNNDGCDSQCRQERCGDSVIQLVLGEECDDGNAVSNDGCSAVCHIERCGDSINQLGEACDDGNNNNNDGCTTQCRLPACGDGLLRNDGDGITEPGEEECEDGNLTNGDGCSSSCLSERCGDGVTQSQLGETCDNGTLNGDPGNPCSSFCELCGNDNAAGDELCDRSDLRGFDLCSDVGLGGGLLECANDCSGFDFSHCTVQPVCGNGQPEGNESCDDGDNIDTNDCTNLCQPAICGDGITLDRNDNNLFDLGDEQCDDGNTFSGDLCSNSCTVAFCGDGFTQALLGEVCDDGNSFNNDGCSNACELEANNPSCGNNIREGAEECDDGDNIPNDECSNSCTLPRCGDAITQSGIGEQCDDGCLAGNPNVCDPPDDADSCNSQCHSTVIEACPPTGQPPSLFAAQGGTTIFPADTFQGSNSENGSCILNQNLTEDAYQLTLMPAPLGPDETITITVSTSDVGADFGLYVRSECDLPNTQLACVNGFGPGQTETIQLTSATFPSSGIIFIFVDIASGAGGTYNLTIDRHSSSTPGSCGDGAVNGNEQCDDGCLKGTPNVCEPIDNGDGCSATCTLDTPVCTKASGATSIHSGKGLTSRYQNSWVPFVLGCP